MYGTLPRLAYRCNFTKQQKNWCTHSGQDIPDIPFLDVSLWFMSLVDLCPGILTLCSIHDRLGFLPQDIAGFTTQLQNWRSPQYFPFRYCKHYFSRRYTCLTLWPMYLVQIFYFLYIFFIFIYFFRFFNRVSLQISFFFVFIS